MQRINNTCTLITSLALLAGFAFNARIEAADEAGSAARVADQIDRLIVSELSSADIKPAPLASDEDFLRRVTFDIAGTLPSPREVTLFGLDPSPDKRAKAIEKLLGTDPYAETWARYWRDVIFSKATNMRAPVVNQSFVSWMTESLKANDGWDDIARAMITASGDVRGNGETAIIFVQEGSPENVAGEVSRIFLGIQMQCANCHDHPWDRWKRDEFHELAAFFPRISLRPVREEMRTVTWEVASVSTNTNDPQKRRQQLLANLDRLYRFMDSNQDGKLTKGEVQKNPGFARGFDRLLQFGDKNKDGALTKTELKEMPPPVQNQTGRGSSEHFMADLANPASSGTKVDPKFFVTGLSTKTGLDDLERRELLSKYITSTRNDWFARSIVNRMWAEMTGEGFYMPIDDMGPDRTPAYPEVLELLATEFIGQGYDLQWLMQTIASTSTYQRQIRPADETGEALPFASATPSRLRGDQLYSAILSVLGGSQTTRPTRRSGANGGGGMYRGLRNPRDAFGALFGFDPSTPQADITGNVPQALFMMNSPMLNNQFKASGFTRLAGLLRKYPDDEDAVNELYLMVLAREPSRKELGIFNEFRAEVGSRDEAFEDLMWSLMNSSEFMSKR